MISGSCAGEAEMKAVEADQPRPEESIDSQTGRDRHDTHMGRGKTHGTRGSREGLIIKTSPLHTVSVDKLDVIAHRSGTFKNQIFSFQDLL